MVKSSHKLKTLIPIKKLIIDARIIEGFLLLFVFCLFNTSHVGNSGKEFLQINIPLTWVLNVKLLCYSFPLQSKIFPRAKQKGMSLRETPQSHISIKPLFFHPCRDKRTNTSTSFQQGLGLKVGAAYTSQGPTQTCSKPQHQLLG